MIMDTVTDYDTSGYTALIASQNIICTLNALPEK